MIYYYGDSLSWLSLVSSYSGGFKFLYSVCTWPVKVHIRVNQLKPHTPIVFNAQFVDVSKAKVDNGRRTVAWCNTSHELGTRDVVHPSQPSCVKW